MSKELSLEDWMNLPDSEKGNKYKELSNHNKYLVRLGGCRPGAIGVVNKKDKDLTEEEKKEKERYYQWLEKLMKEDDTNGKK